MPPRASPGRGWGSRSSRRLSRVPTFESPYFYHLIANSSVFWPIDSTGTDQMTTCSPAVLLDPRPTDSNLPPPTPTFPHRWRAHRTSDNKGFIKNVIMDMYYTLN